VPNVEEFPGHIACSSLSQSEIVLPIVKNNEVIGVLDVDSEHLNFFDEVDEAGLKQIIALLNF
jgi:GAF domain-containing protein